MQASSMAVAFHAPKSIAKLDPHRVNALDLDTIHPMLRGSLGKKNSG